MNQLIIDKDEVIANVELIRQMLTDNGELITKRDALQGEIEVTVEMTQSIVEESARVAQNQEDYNKRYNSLVERSVLDFYDYVCYNKISKSVWIFLRNQTHFSPCTLCECVAIF